MPSFSLDDPLPHFSVRTYLHGPTLFGHKDGGHILVRRTSIDWRIRAEFVSDEKGELCDTIRFRRTIADDGGRIHRLDTHVSSYEVWSAFCCQPVYSERSFVERWRDFWPEKALHICDLRLWSDGRDVRYLTVEKSSGNQPDVFRIVEHCLSGRLQLFHLARRTTTDTDVASKAAVLWCSDVDYQSIVDASRDAPVPLITSIDWNRLIWRNYAAPVEEGGVHRWRVSPVPAPLAFEATGRFGEPLHGVCWNL